MSNDYEEYYQKFPRRYEKKKEPEKVKVDPNYPVEQRVRLCMHEPDLEDRLLLLQALEREVPRASTPYIQLLIRKTKQKIGERDAI